MTSYQSKTNVYDSIAEKYELTDFAIAKKYSYGPTLLHLCKDTSGKRVVDVACGSGYSTRLLVENCSPKSVVGIDASKRMIALAVQHEKENPQGIKYVQGEVTEFDFNTLQPIDVITALFLLHYAKSKEELSLVCQSIYAALPSGGKFITVTSNSEYPEMVYKKYEVTSTLSSLQEGASRTVTYWKGEEELCSFQNYYWKRDTLKQALTQAGFKKVSFYEPIVSTEGYKVFGEPFWKEYFENPHIIGIVCVK